MYKILLYYKYITIDDPKKLCEDQRTLCQRLGLTGRIIVATEGINGTVEGTDVDVEKYMKVMKRDVRFTDVKFKVSEGTGDAFPKLRVRVRPEIVSLHLGDQDIDPTKITGKYITAEQLHEWIWGRHDCFEGFDHNNRIASEGKKFYIIDMRNDYEYAVGRFENSLFPGMQNFRYLREQLPELEHLKNKTVVTVCTGGVRCEKASGFLLTQGFNDVYQLKDGIVSYMEKYPNLDFKGKLYVFDKRLVMGFNTDDNQHEIIGTCKKCGVQSERFINCLDDDCARHFILCESCSTENGRAYCPMGCREGY